VETENSKTVVIGGSAVDEKTLRIPLVSDRRRESVKVVCDGETNRPTAQTFRRVGAASGQESGGEHLEVECGFWESIEAWTRLSVTICLRAGVE